MNDQRDVDRDGGPGLLRIVDRVADRLAGVLDLPALVAGSARGWPASRITQS